ncbi:MAG TPA: hypothetical protein VH164_09195 [Ktedonobacteraceae bacterium]|jgi:hypothetical protein|nr:hypothetical protein [Ktedonobacteraceae bacterium]
MNMHDFLRKYGTRAVSMLLRELAVRKKNAEVAMEAANDLQAMLEHMITHNELMAMSVREVVAIGTEHGKTGD